MNALRDKIILEMLAAPPRLNDVSALTRRADIKLNPRLSLRHGLDPLLVKGMKKHVSEPRELSRDLQEASYTLGREYSYLLRLRDKVRRLAASACKPR